MVSVRTKILKKIKNKVHQFYSRVKKCLKFDYAFVVGGFTINFIDAFVNGSIPSMHIYIYIYIDREEIYSYYMIFCCCILECNNIIRPIR
jgi:hypothetical protein